VKSEAGAKGKIELISLLILSIAGNRNTEIEAKGCASDK
jgi:hypothetical protein